MTRAKVVEVEVDEITIDGTTVKLRAEELPIDQVRLDPANPRLANTAGMRASVFTAAGQKELEEMLWGDDDVRALLHQVRTNGGLIERIIVREDGTVIEGNCRTVVYRKLALAHPKEPRWRTIPARVLPGVEPRKIAILLGEMHVAGKNTWSAFEKAGHVFRLHKDFALTQEEIAQRLRMSKSKVNHAIRAFDAMKNKFLPKYPTPSNVKKFSYFEELYKKPQLREWLEGDSTALGDFIDWVGTGKLQGADVRELPEIVAVPEARRALGKDGFKAAQKLVGSLSRLFRDMEEMAESLRKAQMDDIQRVRRGDRRASDIVLELRESLDRFMELSGVEVDR